MAENAGNKKGSSDKSQRNATTAAKEYAKISSSIQISDEERLKIIEAIENKIIKTAAELHKQVLSAEKLFTIEKQRTREIENQNTQQQEQINLLEDQTDLTRDIAKLTIEITDAKENLVSLDKDSVTLLQDQVKLNKTHIQDAINSGKLSGKALDIAKDNLKTLESQEVSTGRMLGLLEDPGFQKLQAGFDASAESAKKLGDGVNTLVSNLPGGAFISKAFGIAFLSQFFPFMTHGSIFASWNSNFIVLSFALFYSYF